MNGEFNRDEQAWIAQAKQLLDAAVEHLDPATTIRLQRARAVAVEHRPAWKSWAVWVTGLALASIAVLAVTVWVHQSAPSEHHAAVPLEDFELVTSVENVELAEDLDFYHWLADDDTTG